MDRLLLDLRRAVRQWRRAPVFAAVAVLTLGLGIGLDTAVFSVVDAVLLRPLPLRNPDALAVLRHHPEGRPEDRLQLSHPMFVALDEGTPRIPASAVVVTSSRMILEEDGVARAVRVTPVSGDFFEVLGSRMAAGVPFGATDDAPGAEPVVVLSHRLWTRELGGDPAVVGSRLELDGTGYRITGVVAPGGGYPRGAEAWIPVVPFAGDAAENPGVGFLEAVVRLPGDGDPATGAAELQAVGDRYLDEQGSGDLDARVALTRLEDVVRGPVRPALMALLGAAGLLLLAACSNVANLLHTRASRRRKELAVRTALGAGRSGLVLQLGAEGAVLAVAAGMAGLAVTVLSVPALLALSPTRLHGAEAATRLGGSVLLFAAGATVLAAVLATLGPVLRIPRGSPAAELRAAGGSSADPAGRRAPGVAVAVQVAVAAVVIVVAGLLVQHVVQLRSTDFGFDRTGVVSMEIVPPPGGFEGDDGGDTFFDALTSRVEAVPGVERAAGVLLRPLQGPQGFDYPFTIEGQDATAHASNPFLNYEAVTPGYFEASGIPLLRGRAFTDADREDAPLVAVVSRSLAERDWPGGDPLGARLKWGDPEADFPWITVVGVAGDARYRSLEATGLDVYVPWRQSPWPLRHLVVRVGDGEPLRVVDAVRREVGALAPGAHVMAVATPADQVAEATAGPGFAALLLAILATLALFLAAVGIYGVLAWSVTQRRKELAIRMALGAPTGTAVRLAMGEGLAWVAGGLAVGLLGALVALGSAGALVADVPAVTPPVLAAVAILVLGLGALASWLPARRVESIDPVVALKSE